MIDKNDIDDNENIKVLCDVLENFLSVLERDRDEVLQECSIYSNADLNALVDNFIKYDCDYNGYDWHEMYVDFIELQLTRNGVKAIEEVKAINEHTIQVFAKEENRIKARMDLITNAKNVFKIFCVWELKKLLITIAHDEYTIPLMT